MSAEIKAAWELISGLEWEIYKAFTENHPVISVIGDNHISEIEDITGDEVHWAVRETDELEPGYARFIIPLPLQEDIVASAVLDSERSCFCTWDEDGESGYAKASDRQDEDGDWVQPKEIKDGSA